MLTTPFFLLNAGSYHSHPSSLFALTALALCLTWGEEHPAASAPFLLAGAAFGLAVLIRPFSALLVGIPLLAAFAPALARSSGLGRAALLFALGGLPFALFLAAVNLSVTGSWWRMAWTYYEPSETLGFGPYGHTPWQGLKTTIRLTAEGVLYTSLVGAVLLVAGWRRRFAKRWLAWTLLLAPIVGHVFWWSHGGNRYGPRLYFEALLPFTVIAGAGLERLTARRRVRTLALVAGTLCVSVSAARVMRAHRQVHERRDVYRVVESAGVANAVVLLTTTSADMVRVDLTRNPPDFERAPVLFGLARGALDADVRQAHPDRAVYFYRWSPGGGALSGDPDR